MIVCSWLGLCFQRILLQLTSQRPLFLLPLSPVLFPKQKRYSADVCVVVAGSTVRRHQNDKKKEQKVELSETSKRKRRHHHKKRLHIETAERKSNVKTHSHAKSKFGHTIDKRGLCLSVCSSSRGFSVRGIPVKIFPTVFLFFSCLYTVHLSRSRTPYSLRFDAVIL